MRMIMRIMDDIAVPKQMKKSCELSVGSRWKRERESEKIMIISFAVLCAADLKLNSATITYTCSRHLIQFREYQSRSH